MESSTRAGTFKLEYTTVGAQPATEERLKTLSNTINNIRHVLTLVLKMATIPHPDYSKYLNIS